jgi:hypothetical protein
VAQQRLLEDDLRKVSTASAGAGTSLRLTGLPSSTNNQNIISETDEEYTFPANSVKAHKDNVITVVQDNMGLDESEREL